MACLKLFVTVGCFFSHFCFCWLLAGCCWLPLAAATAADGCCLLLLLAAARLLLADPCLLSCFAVGCLLLAASCWLLAAGWLLHAAGCLLRAACCLLLAACCRWLRLPMFAAGCCWLLLVAAGCCYLLLAACCCLLLLARCLLQISDFTFCGMFGTVCDCSFSCFAYLFWLVAGWLHLAAAGCCYCC